MNVNNLKHRITIQKLESGIDDNGWPIEEWRDHSIVWASKNNLSGREYYQAMAVQQENTVEFGIRYAPFVDEMDSKSYRISHGSKIYNITFIDTLDYQKVFTVIKSLEWVI